MSDGKRILIVSLNVLFSEVVSQALCGHANLECIQRDPSKVLEEIKDYSPDVIVVDESVEPDELRRLFIAVQDLPCAQVLLMNLHCNDIVVMDTHRVVIGEAGDLWKVIDSITRKDTKWSSKNLKRNIFSKTGS